MTTTISYFTTTEKKIKRSQFHPFSYMTSHQINNMSNITGITSGAEHPSYAQVFSEVVQTLVYCFVDQCLPFCPFSFSHFIVL